MIAGISCFGFGAPSHAYELRNDEFTRFALNVELLPNFIPNRTMYIPFYSETVYIASCVAFNLYIIDRNTFLSILESIIRRINKLIPI